MKADKYKFRWAYSKAIPGRLYCAIGHIDDKQPFEIAFAECSVKDHFNKDTGRKLSLARVLKIANIPKEERKSIWETYRTMTVKPRW
jgi:hypothetical protein